MRKRINLLSKQKSYILYGSYFKALRIIAYLSLSIFIASLISVYLLREMQKNNLDVINKEKQNILGFFLQNAKNEAEIIYFAKKNKQFQDFLKEDIKFSNTGDLSDLSNTFAPYYKFLTDSIKIASGSTLENVKINKDRSTSFTVQVSSYDSFKDYLQYVESDAFLNQFSQLMLKDLTGIEDKNSKYQLSFSGMFKEKTN